MATITTELQTLLARPNLDLMERVAVKLALDILDTPPNPEWTEEEYGALSQECEPIGLKRTSNILV